MHVQHLTAVPKMKLFVKFYLYNVSLYVYAKKIFFIDFWGNGNWYQKRSLLWCQQGFKVYLLLHPSTFSDLLRTAIMKILMVNNDYMYIHVDFFLFHHLLGELVTNDKSLKI